MYSVGVSPDISQASEIPITTDNPQTTDSCSVRVTAALPQNFRALPRVNPELFSSILVTDAETEAEAEAAPKTEDRIFRVKIWVVLFVIVLIISLGTMLSRIQSNQVTCPAGYELKNDSGSFLTKSICVACPVGSHRSHSSIECILCPPGFFTAGKGAAFCQNETKKEVII